MTDQLAEQGADAGVKQYRREIRSAVRGVWSAALSWEDGWESMDITIRRMFNKAFQDGAKSVGVLPAELTPEEKLKLRQTIQQETSYISGLLDAADAQSKANKGKLTPLYKRVELWVQRYQQIYTDGMMMARGDPKLKWVYSHTVRNHCSSCQTLNDKIKRKSQWDKSGLRPQSPNLECMRSAAPVTVCQCHFEPTTEPASRGPLPRA